MRSGLVLTARHLRTAVRQPGLWSVLLVGCVVLVVVLLTTRGSTRLTGGLLVVASLAFGAAVWAGGLLPGDRVAGREVWLATLAPSGALRRLSAALAGALLALAVALLGALALGLATAPGSIVRATEDQPELHGRVIPAGGGKLEFGIPSASRARTLELVFGKRYLSREAPADPVAVTARVGAASAESSTLSRAAPLLVEVPAEAVNVVLVNRSPATRLVVREARLLGSRRPYLLSILLAGLLLGAGAATAAPLSVVVSRWTPRPTASASGLVVALAGGLHAFVDDVETLVGGGWEAFGLGVVGVAARLAPDLRPLGVFTAPGEGYALDAAVLGTLAPLGLYALVVFALVALPLPSTPSPEDAS